MSILESMLPGFIAFIRQGLYKADVLEKFSEDGLYPGRTPSSEIFPDETDRVFYEISLSVEDAYVETNNVKHFPKVTRVVTPSEMLMLLHESGEI